MIHKILIVDDEPANLRLLERMFSHELHCLTASSGAEAIRMLERHDVSLLISDQRMPKMTGIELLKQTAAMRPHMVRILLTGYTDVDALVEAINSGLVYMYITKPWNNDDLRLRVHRACQHYEENKNRQALAEANQRLILRLVEVKLGVANSLSEMLKIRDEHAHEHALRVRNCAIMIAAKMDISEEEKEDLSIAALLHDLAQSAGNGVASKALSKRKQTIVQAHFDCESKLLHGIPEFADVAEILHCYPENFDGSGSPNGLQAEQIPLRSRILRLADEYDQMRLPKVSSSMTHNEVMRILSQRSGKQYDPILTEVLARLAPEELGKYQYSITAPRDDTHLSQDTFVSA
jgi:response regulator RpfG family c-di-GMP phosphodiesterase